MNKLLNVFKCIWKDPVWSKVISAILIAIIWQIYGLVSSFIKHKKFTETIAECYYWFVNNDCKTKIFVIIGITIIVFVLPYLINLTVKFVKSRINQTKDDSLMKPSFADPVIQQNSTDSFAYRLAQAFPGQRELEWYKSKEAVKRLSILLQPPLMYDFDDLLEGVDSDPIWWFRGGFCGHIDSFKTISKSKIIIAGKELKINIIAVYVSVKPQESFIYIETEGEPQTQLYNISRNEICQQILLRGYASEEYAQMDKFKIKRVEFDDGAALIGGKNVKTIGAELRERYLSKYNFIISAKRSVYNSRKFDAESLGFFNDIVKGGKKADEFINMILNK
jgi:hypothetical protein